MTFTEAAAHVLRLVGKPLHYKEITDVAIEKNLLSHVGKSPEVTMGARLAAIVQKGDKDAELVRIKPGVFALKDWDDKTIKQGLADRTPALERFTENGDAAVEPAADAAPVPAGSSPHAGAGEFDDTPPDDDDDDEPLLDDQERARAEMLAGASDVFEVEADDDLPIFGSDEAPRPDDRDRGGEDRGGGDPAGRRRRRRRRRGGRSGTEANGGGGGDGLPTYTVSEAGTDAPGQSPAGRNQAEPSDRGRSPIEQGDRGQGDRGQGDRGRNQFEPGEPLEDLASGDLADALAALVPRRGGPVPLRQLVDSARNRGRMSGDPQVLQSLIAAAVRADNLRAEAAGRRPRFRLANGRVGSTDAMLDDATLDLERQIMNLAGRYRDAAHRLLVRRFTELQPRAFAELVVLLLERLGVQRIRPVRRPGSGGTELGFVGDAPGPLAAVRTAYAIRRDGREVGREQVTELRGALHHFDGAQAACIVCTGSVLSGAREEASSEGAAPVALIDGATLAALCSQHGVAVISTMIALPVPDGELFEALRSG